MPELPEAETVRRQLEPAVTGARIARAWARLDRRTRPDTATFETRLPGRRIVQAARHGKQLYFPLDDGTCILIHLGMSGRLRVDPLSIDPEEAPRHVHMLVTFDDGRQMVFTDPRTFGLVGWSPDLSFLANFGPEPFSGAFDEAALVEKLRSKATPIKAALLDQRLLAGLGNIYADEVCWLARVHPARRACDVPVARLRELVSHVRPVLQRGVESRGATLKDGGYQDIFGEDGAYYPYAYGNTGEPCQRCATRIKRGVLGPGKSARSYHFCPRCQRR